MTVTNATQQEEQVIHELIERAIEEDVKTGDATTEAIVAEDVQAEAFWIAKGQGIVAGLDVARQVFQRLDPDLVWKSNYTGGDSVQPGMKIVEMAGTCRALLTGERIALNIAQRMSGIATMTHEFVELIDDLPTQILDTRKTVPGLRLLDKQAVKAGGGMNHRLGLFDLAMIKDNHIVAAGSIAEAVNMVRKAHPELRIEVETTNLKQVDEALAAGADIIMLDNMSTDMMKKAVKKNDGAAKTEASGNITLDRVREVAEAGVDYISIGALTHSVKAFDISQQLHNIF